MMRIKVFKASYNGTYSQVQKESSKLEDNVNKFILDLQLKRSRHQVTVLDTAVYVLYDDGTIPYNVKDVEYPCDLGGDTQ